MDSLDVFRRLVLNHNLTRREALRHLAKAGGAAAIAPLLHACGSSGGSDALLGPPTERDLRPEDLRGKLGPVVFLMQENRSFDHYFGSLRLLEGRTDADGLTGEEENLLPDGTPVRPAKLAEPCVFDPRHGWYSQRAQFAEGRNSGFVTQHYEEVTDFLAGIGRTGDYAELAQHAMRYHTRDQLPFYYAIADEFALCNRWFSSLMSSTWGNRFYFLGAENEGHKGNDDEILLAGGLKGPLILDRLDDAGIPWKYYYVDVPPLLLYVEKYLRSYASRSFNMAQFYKDAEAGTLPPFVLLDSSIVLGDEHPPHHIQVGQAFVASVLGALMKGPQWESSLFVLTYDECGGFYDHVPPPKFPDARSSPNLDDDFGQAGFRMPATISGAFVKRRYASNAVMEHTSAMKFLQWLWDLPPITERDAAAETFLDVFDLGRVLANDPRPAPAMPEAVFDESTFRAQCIDQKQTDLERAMARGLLPKAFDRRANLWNEVAAMSNALERMKMGGFRRG